MSEFINTFPLYSTIEALRSGSLDLVTYVKTTLDRVDDWNGVIRAILPEPGRRERLVRDAEALLDQYPDPKERPPLFGALLGIKDVFITNGYDTRMGSALPAGLFTGSEAVCVDQLRVAGALVLGKTVTTEFAYLDPGATANPHNIFHTPGGSSSGSAAGVAAGMVGLALGTQTVGSTIRPASYCGVVGYKPSLARINKEGLLPFSTSADHVGVFTQDVLGMVLAASVLCEKWSLSESYDDNLPILGIPDGPYIDQADETIRLGFEAVVTRLGGAGYEIRRISMFDDINEIQERYRDLISAEFTSVHADWFVEYGPLYRPKSAMLFSRGQAITEQELTIARLGIVPLRMAIEQRMKEAEIDVWICPSTTSIAPEGLSSTGDASMNLPWTYAGLPAVTLPSGMSSDGLPIGTQVVARFMDDEKLLAWCVGMEDVVAP